MIILTTISKLIPISRTLKTDLGLRPIYHQKTNRISGHIFISVLAYHILHSVHYQLKLSNINDSWQTIMS